MSENTHMRVTALENFTLQPYPAFQKGQEYVILQTIGKVLLSRGLVEMTVVKVTKLDEEGKDSKKSKGSLGTAK